MPCTKTGCHAFIECYNEYVYGDAFELDSVAYFRIVKRQRHPIRPTLDYTIYTYDTWHDKDARVSTLITNQFAKAQKEPNS
jgi:hypothetical protein